MNMRTGKIQPISIYAIAGATLIATSALAQLWNQPAQMAAASSAGGGGHAIAFVGSGPMGVSSGSTSTLSASYAISAGTHEGLVFCVGSLASDVISVTYNGASATQLVAFGSGFYPQALWYLPLGNTMAGSHIATITAAANDTIFAVLGEYSGIQQTTSADGSSHIANGTTSAISVTTAASGDWVMLCSANNTDMSAGAGDVQRQLNTGGGAANPNLFDSNGPVSVGSNSFTINTAPDIAAVGLQPG
jgi:hypothetical protein